MAAALADATSNPTVRSFGSHPLRFNGTTWDRARVPSKFVDLNGVSITTIATLWDPASGKKFRLMGGSISVSAACNVLFEDNSAGAGNFVFRTPKLEADKPFTFYVGSPDGDGKLSAAADNNLKGTSSTAATITGTLWGTEE